jgi:AbrB family looped-hinge helix DNA binding protein
MKATGIVRRIDGLGRIVLPKEIRKSFGMAENDPVEIFTDKHTIVLRKYNPSCDYAERIRPIRENIAGDSRMDEATKTAALAALDKAMNDLEGKK